jgi:hypothetical protein
MTKITNSKAKTTKAPKATQTMPKAAVEIINADPAFEVPPTEEARQEQMATDLTKLKAGDKKRKASVKAAKAPKATPEKVAKVAQPAKAKATKAPKPAKAAKEPKGTSKKDQVLALISRKNGASLDEIMTAMGWQKHTVRGFIAILNRTTKVESFKTEAGVRTYKAA